ncbi:hypothetical protein TNIN_121401 [Trichonephila inaurata madagascariensis]|uniref:Uncharacterized protein n=1 Tax=Trichonephila inaurata madagascariensis TaxID=2747483 RepID=A0A8X7BZR6_9ARAC|nr:hypothetical protein TNIN_121401 [Trichonephila inaurata madagascariensis]
MRGELKHLSRREMNQKILAIHQTPTTKNPELNRLQNTIKRKVNLYRQQVWEDHLTSLDAEDGSLWGTAKAFRRKAPFPGPMAQRYCSQRHTKNRINCSIAGGQFQ